MDPILLITVKGNIISSDKWISSEVPANYSFVCVQILSHEYKPGSNNIIRVRLVLQANQKEMDSHLLKRDQWMCLFLVSLLRFLWSGLLIFSSSEGENRKKRGKEGEKETALNS